MGSLFRLRHGTSSLLQASNAALGPTPHSGDHLSDRGTDAALGPSRQRCARGSVRSGITCRMPRRHSAFQVLGRLYPLPPTTCLGLLRGPCTSHTLSYRLVFSREKGKPNSSKVGEIRNQISAISKSVRRSWEKHCSAPLARLAVPRTGGGETALLMSARELEEKSVKRH